MEVQYDRSSRAERHANALLAAIICVFAVMSPSTVARAESGYPLQAITLIVPFAAGGPTDVVARIVADEMSRTLGQPIIIENVVGSGGTTAAIRAKRSPPDGYTIVMGHMGTHAAAVALYPNLAYDPVSDFEPIGIVAGMPVMILARKDLAPKTLDEFVQFLRASGSTLNMAHAGVGSVSFTTCSLFNAIAGARPKMISFQGTGPAMNALVAGRADYMCDQVVNVVPRLAAGSIKAYAVGTTRRNPVLPAIPTSVEAGAPAFQASAWNALFAPKETPQAVILTLNRALGRALDDPGVRKQLLDLGGEIPDLEGRSPQSLTNLVKAEIVKWASVIKSSDPEH